MTGGTESAVPNHTAPSRRLKSLTILAVVVWSALVFLAWSQPWFTLSAVGRAGDSLTVTVQGAAAAPALSALALAGLALAAALAIAGPVVRAILGLLELVLGASIAASAISAVANPVLAGQSAVTAATGVAGSASIQAIATTAGSSLWPWLAIVCGALIAVTGILIIVTLRRWPVSGRKYQSVTFRAADGRTSGDPADLIDDTLPLAPATDAAVTDAPGTGSQPGIARADDDSANTAAVDSWDRLSHGQDPTV